MILPPSTIGILGGGQLGRMLAMSAANMGYKTLCLTPQNSEPAPAEQVCNEIIYADYTDESALKDFANKCDLVTFEFENIPAKSLEFLEKLKHVHPSSKAIYNTQNRSRERNFLKDNNFPTHRFRQCNSAEDIKSALDDFKIEKAILKTTDYGYDGKGQVKINKNENIEEAWKNSKFSSAILEEFVDFDFEVSVILARRQNGETEIFPIGRNIHESGILRSSEIPITLSDKTSDKAIEVANSIAEKLGYIGVMAVEFFVLKGGDIYVNEIAPRVHNSGHWTMDGCNVSQFDQHIRAICDLPLIKPRVIYPHIRMENIIGEDIQKLSYYYSRLDTKVHLYGKREIKSGRKLGHVNFISV